MQLLTGFLLAAVVSILAHRARALSRSGALAAAVLGTIVFGLGGLEWAVLLLAFFLSSSALSRAFRRRKTRLAEKFSKGPQRDATQVLANGGAAGLCVLLHTLFPAASWPWLAFASSLAAVNADTWATELGVLNPDPPRLLSSLRQVEPGTSGAVSFFGTLAALAGAFFIALPAVAFLPESATIRSSSSLAILVIITLAGLAGSLVDSGLGATLQAIYFCPACHKETERHPLHSCGQNTRLLRGLPWLNNDLVNIACSITGIALALLGALILG